MDARQDRSQPQPEPPRDPDAYPGQSPDERAPREASGADTGAVSETTALDEAGPAGDADSVPEAFVRALHGHCVAGSLLEPASAA